MIITNHWSGTSEIRLHDYHVEYALCRPLELSYIATLLRATSPKDIDWEKLRSYFKIYKNFEFNTPTRYGTFWLNHDPRDGSSNIEFGALCMGGENVKPYGSWGLWPFTIAHAWMVVGLNARVAQICNLDASASFGTIQPEFQNAPMFTISTHAERAWQTISPDAKVKELGYFLYSGDPDCRWNLAVLRAEENWKLRSAKSAVMAAQASAEWIRKHAHDLKSAGIHNLWNLDKGVTP